MCESTTKLKKSWKGMVCEREGKKAHEKMAEAQCHARVMSNHLKNEKPSQFKVKYIEKKKKAALFIYVTATDCVFCTVRCMPQDSAQPQVRNVCDTWRTKKHNACVRSPDSNIN